MVKGCNFYLLTKTRRKTLKFLENLAHIDVFDILLTQEYYLVFFIDFLRNYDSLLLWGGGIGLDLRCWSEGCLPEDLVGWKPLTKDSLS